MSTNPANDDDDNSAETEGKLKTVNHEKTRELRPNGSTTSSGNKINTANVLKIQQSKISKAKKAVAFVNRQIRGDKKKHVEGIHKDKDNDQDDYDKDEKLDPLYDTATKFKEYWTDYYKDVDSQIVYFEYTFDQYCDPNEKLDSVTRDVMQVIANIGLRKDNPEKVAECYNIDYQWVAELKLAFQEEKVRCGISCLAEELGDIMDHTVKEMEQNPNQQYTTIPKGMKYKLQLKNHNNNTWVDWLYLASSTLKHGNVGVFANQQFKKGAPIGYMIGKTVWKSKVCGGQEPSQQKMDAEIPKSDFESYQLPVRNSDGYYTVIEPEPMDKFLTKEQDLGAGEPRSLWMGMHYLFDALSTFRQGKFDASMRKPINAEIADDGYVYATGRIEKGQEIFIMYDKESNSKGVGKKEREVIEITDDNDDDESDGGRELASKKRPKVA